MLKKSFELDLQLFAEGGAEGVSGTSAQSDLGVSQATEVVYGTQPAESENGSVTESQNNEPSVDDGLDEEFASFIKKDGKYSKQYQKELNKHLSERTKSLNKQKQEAERAHQKYADSVNPIIDSLAARYGVENTDFEGLQKAIDADDKFYEQAALDKGVSHEEFKAHLKNDMLQKQMQENHNRQVAQQKVQAWVQEAEQLKTTYPDFNLEQELLDPAFASLIHNGVSMKNAYETIHLDEILAGATNQVAQTVERKVANSVRANKARPVENGVSSQSASKVVKNSVSNLSYEDMDEIERQARAGKKITFRK